VIVAIIGSSRERDRVLAAYEAVRTHPHMSLALDWIACMDAEKPDADLTHQDRQSYAIADLNAIDDADVVWLLASSEMSDSRTEYGYSLGTGKPVVASGHLTLFTALADAEYAADAEAFAWLDARAS